MFVIYFSLNFFVVFTLIRSTNELMSMFSCSFDSLINPSVPYPTDFKIAFSPRLNIFLESFGYFFSLDNKQTKGKKLYLEYILEKPSKSSSSIIMMLKSNRQCIKLTSMWKELLTGISENGARNRYYWKQKKNVVNQMPYASFIVVTTTIAAEELRSPSSLCALPTFVVKYGHTRFVSRHL